MRIVDLLFDAKKWTVLKTTRWGKKNKVKFIGKIKKQNGYIIRRISQAKSFLKDLPNDIMNKIRGSKEKHLSILIVE